MRGACPTHISRTNIIGPTTPHLGWTVGLGQFPTMPAVLSAPTVDKYGNIYVGTQPVGGYTGGLLALNPDGGTRWFHDTGTNEVRAGGTITADDSIISASSDGTVFELDKDGGLKWSVNVGQIVSDAPLIGPDGTIYIGDQHGNFYALYSDGGTRWSYNPFGGGGSIFGGATLAPDGHVLASDSSSVVRFAADGGEIPYGFGPGSNSIIEAPVTIGPDNVVWFGTEDGYLWATNQIGTTLLEVPYAFSGLSHFFNNPAAGFDDRVFFAAPGAGSSTVDNAVYTAKSDGGAATFHSFDAGAGIQAQLAIDGAGNVYAIAGTVLSSLGPDGGVRWTFGLDNTVQTGMAFGADGTIYVGTTGGTIYAITP